MWAEPGRSSPTECASWQLQPHLTPHLSYCNNTRQFQSPYWRPEVSGEYQLVQPLAFLHGWWCLQYLYFSLSHGWSDLTSRLTWATPVCGKLLSICWCVRAISSSATTPATPYKISSISQLSGFHTTHLQGFTGAQVTAVEIMLLRNHNPHTYHLTAWMCPTTMMRKLRYVV